MLRRLRPAFVATAGILHLGCCPERIVEGDGCWVARTCQAQGRENDCGLNGFTCKEGKWDADYTYCNPPRGGEDMNPATIDPASLEPLVGKRLADVVAQLKLREATFRYEDEPPGKLRTVVAVLAKGEPPEELELHLRYDAKLLFSAERAWSLARIGAAEVVGLQWRRGAERRAFGAVSPGP